MSIGAVGGIPRGCGRRKAGGAYMECGGSPVGRPIEYFLLCPPQVVDPKELGITAVGVQLVELEGTWHVIDWVGEKYYPHVADFIEEVRRFGASRRLPKDLDYSKLTPESRMILLHPQAHIDEPFVYDQYRIGGKAFDMEWDKCPKDKIHTKSEMCAGLFWEDVRSVKHDKNIRIGDREMPSFTYRAATPPGKEKVKHSLAMFAMLPITRLVVIQSKDGSHERTFEAVSKSSIDSEVVDE